jgi:hypothetical protein
VNERLTTIWWENPTEELTFEEAKEKLKDHSAAKAMGDAALRKEWREGGREGGKELRVSKNNRFQHRYSFSNLKAFFTHPAYPTLVSKHFLTNNS